MEKPILIGLHGNHTNIGKSLVSKAINYYLDDWKIESFSNIPKKHYCELNHLDSNTFNNRELKEIVRPSFISYCENIKKINPYIFANALLKNQSKLIIDDVRFKEEFELIKENNGIVIHIEKASVNPIDNYLIKLVDFDYFLNANCNKDELLRRIKEMLIAYSLI